MAEQHSSGTAIDWDTDHSQPVAAEIAGPVEISWDFDVLEGGLPAEPNGGSTGMDAPVEISWDLDVEETEIAEGTGISWDVEPDASTADGLGSGEGTGAADIDWEVQMEGSEAADASRAKPEGVAIEWDVSPEDGEGAVSSASRDVCAVPCQPLEPAAQDAVISALISNSDFRTR